MLTKTLQFFKLFDAFGIPIMPRVEPNQQYYKSAFGGISSFLICMLSMSYTGFVFFQWKTYQISPKMSSVTYQSDFTHLDLNYDIFKLYSWPSNSSYIDPFKENVLVPILMGKRISTSEITIEALNISESLSTARSVQLQFNKGLNIYHPNGSVFGDIQYQLAIIECKQYLLQNNQRCANESQTKKYFSQPNNVIIFKYQSFILNNNQQPAQNIQTFILRIEQQFSISMNFNLLSNFYQIRDDLFTDASKQAEFLSGASVYGQTNSIESIYRLSGFNIYANLVLTLQAQQTLTIIEYPHIGELLASIGSIISILFLLRYLIIQINYQSLWDDVIFQTMTFYYPNLIQIRYQYSWFGKIQAIYYRDKSVDIQQFEQFREKLKSRIQDKLTFNNMTYEISRLYFIVRRLATDDIIKNSHFTGIQLKSFTVDDLRINNKNEQIWSDEDLDYISLHRRKLLFDSVNEEMIAQSSSNRNYDVSFHT